VCDHDCDLMRCEGEGIGREMLMGEKYGLVMWLFDNASNSFTGREDRVYFGCEANTASME
jgi:hypothetical protein